MPTWKAGGYVIRLYEHDHPPLHVHVFKDSREVARFVGRVRKALKSAGLID
jgi:hypothetical protein